jgi:hypothetical protein
MLSLESVRLNRLTGLFTPQHVSTRGSMNVVEEKEQARTVQFDPIKPKF